ncbi:MAG: glycine--tRNA ligase subunit beta, partial [Alphaproteobacteria bacterium]
MAELLLELFSEEIPARMQARAADDLKRLVTDRLTAAGLKSETAAAHGGPRRITLMVDGLPDTQPDVTEEKRGPRTDAPEKAIQGFLKGNGLTLEQCEKREIGKGEFWFAVIERKGEATIDLLPSLLAEAIAALPWPKSMRWWSGSLRWVRPLQRVLCVLDGDVVGLEMPDGVPVGNKTSGHRFHGPDEFDVAYFKDYSENLHRNRVMVDAADRRHVIEQAAAALAEKEGLKVRHDPLLLAEVAGLVEWPVTLIGAIDEQFMDLPDEVLTTSMRSHQKYFALLDEDGNLAPRFVVVANVETADGGSRIVAGNERVLRARLSDAKFFWDQDRRQTLESRVPALGEITFHAKLGTLADKVARMEALAAELAPSIPGCDRDQARSGANLCKADLTTGMVGEFPELQGIMGRYYALAEGEKAEVAGAIADHYSPAGPNDDCPTAPVSVAVALADKIDTLAGFWAIDEKPTGSRDPYALRRAALGVIRLVLENGLRLKLREVFNGAFDLYDDAGGTEGSGREQAIADLMDFFADRLKVHLRETGVRHDLISAVFALGGEDDLVRIVARVEALGEFLESDDGANLLTAYRRASNIVRIE